MKGLDSFSPFENGSPVRIEKREIKSRVSIGLPGHVPARREGRRSRSANEQSSKGKRESNSQEGGSRDIDDLDSHEIQVVQRPS